MPFLLSNKSTHNRVVTRSLTVRYSGVVLLFALATILGFMVESRALPIAILVSLFAIFIAGRLINSLAGTLLVLVTTVGLEYFFIPPLKSFQVTGAGAILILNYLAVAVLLYMASSKRGPFTPSATKYNGPGLRWICDDEGMLSSVSSSWTRFTGLAPDASSGFQWLSRIHPADREAVNQLFRRNFMGMNKTACRILHDTGDYERFHVTARFSSAGFGSTVVLTALPAEA